MYTSTIARDHVSSPFIPLVYTPAVHHEVIIPLHLRDDLLPSQRKRPTIGWWENNRTEKRSDPNVKERQILLFSCPTISTDNVDQAKN